MYGLSMANIANSPIYCNLDGYLLALQYLQYYLVDLFTKKEEFLWGIIIVKQQADDWFVPHSLMMS